MHKDDWLSKPEWASREFRGADRAILLLIFLDQFFASILFLWGPYGPYGAAPSLFGFWGLISAFGLGFTGIASRLIAMLWHVSFVSWVLVASKDAGHVLLFPSICAILYLGLSAFALYQRPLETNSTHIEQHDLRDSTMASSESVPNDVGAAVGAAQVADRMILIVILLGQVYFSIGLFWLAASKSGHAPPLIFYALGLWGVVSGFGLGFLGSRSRLFAFLWNTVFLLVAVINHLHGRHIVSSFDLYCAVFAAYLGGTARLLQRRRQRDTPPA